MVKSGQSDQDVGGDVPLPELVVAVNLLGAVQIIGDFPLLQIFIFS